MKFSDAWLREYVTIGEPPERVGARLTAAGIPLDGIEGSGADAVYDFDVFTNRPDCMNHLGLAREYAALTGSPLKPPETAVPKGGGPTARSATVAIEDQALCARYSARAVLGIRVDRSPDWLRRRLESIGQRPINGVVDATNFVLWEMGHPLHAFDLDRLSGHRVVVRRARPGEILTTLDGIERRLTAEMLVIADAERAQALAGIMGGRATEIGPATRNVLLESAWFDPASVRRTARALGLRTDASHRFERGADPEGTIEALDRAARLIAEVAGGTVTDPCLDIHPRPFPPRAIRFRPARARALLGFDLPDETMKEALERRAFAVSPERGRGRETAWTVGVPSFRRDVEREVDLIEEAARHRGYDAIPAALPLLPDAGGGPAEADRILRVVRHSLETAGLSEAVNTAFVEREDCRLFEPDLEKPLAVENPLQAQAAFLRPSLLPGLLRNVAHNLNHGLESCLLYEIGTAFRPGRGLPEERTLAAFVVAGRGVPAHWNLPARDVDLYDAKGAVELLAELLGISPLAFSSDRMPFLAQGRALRVARDGRPLGIVGELAPHALERYGIERPAFGGELAIAALLGERRAERRYRPLPRYPAVRRDLALVVGDGVTFEAIERVIRQAATLPVAAVRVFDRYRGAGIPEGRVSVAVQVVFQHPERTLSAEEVQSAQDAIVEALGRTVGARLRGMPGG
jgi:phenylalanyl-tRNA synthetase beta chain